MPAKPIKGNMYPAGQNVINENTQKCCHAHNAHNCQNMYVLAR